MKTLVVQFVKRRLCGEHAAVQMLSGLVPIQAQMVGTDANGKLEMPVSTG
jgi:hypothetical protein